VQGLRGIAYAYNALHFEFASPSFDAEEQTVYSHRLTGFEDHWSEWSALPFKEYTNLREGDYVFEVKARNAYGYESLPASYRFSVAPPWYRTWPMYLGYAATALLLVWALVRWNTRRLEEDKLRLERTVEERTAEIRQQKEEITAQAENLRQMNEEIRAQAESLIEANEHIQLQKEQVEKSFQDVRVLSEIGQQLTKELDVEALIRQVYAQVNALMPAPAFGVGVYEPAYNRLAFPGFIENGEPLPLAYDSLKERNKLSIRCFQHKQEIIIGDADVEIDKILGIVASEVPVLGRRPASILYLPLVVEGEAVGVITVQSFERQAYSEKDVSLLRSLASYVAIALDNARAYAQVQETNRRITDSIRYAKTIQSAMLPPASVLRQSLGEHFIFFQPKDLVSGDFYWMAEAGGYTFAAVVDCTGHGVPGGFMSLIGHNLLHDLVMAKGLRSTTAIMEGMDAGVRQVLHQDESLNDDGMDVCLCRLERLPDGRVALEYCGVRRPLYWFRQEGGVLETVKGNHKGIGGKVYDNLRFEAQERLLAPGDALYLTTDGMGDLHNPDNEKFTSGRLMDWLLEHAPLPMEQQRLALEGHYRDFKKQAEQRDDIAVMGIRIEKR
jgi:serine phosphatase RsbU (regulator of sigma subunit)